MPVTKTAPIDKRQAQAILQKLYVHIEEAHNLTQDSHAKNQSQDNQKHHFEDLNVLFTNNLELISNGQVKCRNLTEYMGRIEKLRNKFSKVKFSASHEEPFFSDHRLAVHYTLTLTPKAGGQEEIVDVMAIATLDGEKISHWNQVSHERNAGHWDK